MLYVNSYAIDNKVWFYTVSGALSRQIKLVLLRAGVGNWRPGGHMRPPPSLNVALRFNITILIYYWFQLLQF